MNTLKINPWVWSKIAESKYPDRQAGESVPIAFLSVGKKEYFPPQSWVNIGYF